MTETTKFDIDGTEHELTLKSINLFCHQGMSRINALAADVEDITPQQTMRFSEQLTQEWWEKLRVMPEFVKQFKLVFTDIEPPARLAQEGSGVKHVVGLIVLTGRVLAAGKRPFWRLPESFLHPRYQLGLADLIIHLSNPK